MTPRPQSIRRADMLRRRKLKLVRVEVWLPADLVERFTNTATLCGGEVVAPKLETEE